MPDRLTHDCAWAIAESIVKYLGNKVEARTDFGNIYELIQNGLVTYQTRRDREFQRRNPIQQPNAPAKLPDV